jgi:hypothetical protein
MKPKKPLSKYEAGVKPSFFRGKMKPPFKYEVKSVNPSSKYEAKETFIEIRSQTVVFVKIRRQRKLRQNLKPKKSLSKYEVRCEAFIFQRKNKTFVKI